eukprot:gene33458-41284_t
MPTKGENAWGTRGHKKACQRGRGQACCGVRACTLARGQNGMSSSMSSKPEAARGGCATGAGAGRGAGFDGLEKSLQEKVQSKLLPASKVDVKFEVRRPPLEANDASRRVAGYGKVIYQELGMSLNVVEKATGGGTDAAFA